MTRALGPPCDSAASRRVVACQWIAADRGNARSKVDTSFVERAAHNRADAPDVTDREEIVDRCDARRGNDLARPDPDESSEQRQVRPTQETIALDGRHFECPDAHLAQALENGLDANRRRVEAPSFADGAAAPDVERNGDAVRAPLSDELGDETRVAQGCRPENDPPGTGRQRSSDVASRAEAASKLAMRTVSAREDDLSRK